MVVASEGNVHGIDPDRLLLPQAQNGRPGRHRKIPGTFPPSPIRTPNVQDALPRFVGWTCADLSSSHTRPVMPANDSTSPAAPTANIRIGGMLVGYYLICPRKAWLSMRGLWMEQTSTTVALGRQVGQQSYKRKKKEIMLTAEAPDGTPLVGKVDWARLEEGVLHETKKGRSCEDAHKWQLRFYLWLLTLNGATRPDGQPFTGTINYPRLRRTETVHLEPEHEARLAEIVADLRRLAGQDHPPPRIDRRAFCKKCAFEELCYG